MAVPLRAHTLPSTHGEAWASPSSSWADGKFAYSPGDVAPGKGAARPVERYSWSGHYSSLSRSPSLRVSVSASVQGTVASSLPSGL